MIPLSVLDLSVVTTGTKPAVALRNSIDLARHVDRLGYVRYWLAEHHNLASVASPAPDLMIGQIAAVTQHIRVGSGGVMLPNHAPLVVAERFKMLEALFPGRIDLGLGRAPGTDRRHGLCVAQPARPPRRRRFPRAAARIDAVGDARFPRRPPLQQGAWRCRTIRRCRRSGCSARAIIPRELAAQVGDGLCVRASFRDSDDAIAAMTDYRAHFEPSALAPDAPGDPGGCCRHRADDRRGGRAARIVGGSDPPAPRNRGQYLRRCLISKRPMAYPYTDAEKRASIARNRARLFVGAPATVMAKLEPLVASEPRPTK